MKATEYRGYSICQQQIFGPLRLVKWAEEGEFIVTKNDVDAMRGATFRTIEDAKQAIDRIERILKRFLQA
jgi:hypothetical protein